MPLAPVSLAKSTSTATAVRVVLEYGCDGYGYRIHNVVQYVPLAVQAFMKAATRFEAI